MLLNCQALLLYSVYICMQCVKLSITCQLGPQALGWDDMIMYFWGKQRTCNLTKLMTLHVALCFRGGLLSTGEDNIKPVRPPVSKPPFEGVPGSGIPGGQRCGCMPPGDWEQEGRLCGRVARLWGTL